MTHCAPCISPVMERYVPQITPEQLMAEAAIYLDVPLTKLMSDTRKPEVRIPRDLIMGYLVNERDCDCTYIDALFQKAGTARLARMRVWERPYRDTYTKLVNFLNGL